MSMALDSSVTETEMGNDADHQIAPIHLPHYTFLENPFFHSTVAV